MDADEAGLSQATIYLPQHAADLTNHDNWPHSLVLCHRIGDALYEQGILSRPIHATFEADLGINQKYNIPIPVPAEE